MTKPLLAILLLATTALSTSAEESDLLKALKAEKQAKLQGELDGRAIACVFSEPSNEDEWLRGNPRWYEFKDGRVKRYSITVEDLTAVIREYQPFDDRYDTAIKTVRWWDNFTLNRENLVLTVETNLIGIKQEHHCKSTDSLDAMHKAIEAARLETQRKIDEQMSNNKI